MKGSKKMKPPTTSPSFDAAKLPLERRRHRSFLLRLNDEEMTKLDAIAVGQNVSRSNVMRMMLKHAHMEWVEVPLRARAESEVAREAAELAREADRLALNDQIERLRKELLATVRAQEGDGRKVPRDRRRAAGR